MRFQDNRIEEEYVRVTSDNGLSFTLMTIGEEFDLTIRTRQRTTKIYCFLFMVRRPFHFPVSIQFVLRGLCHSSPL